jgi:hypothetical protein
MKRKLLIGTRSACMVAAFGGCSGKNRGNAIGRMVPERARAPRVRERQAPVPPQVRKAEPGREQAEPALQALDRGVAHRVRDKGPTPAAPAGNSSLH